MKSKERYWSEIHDWLEGNAPKTLSALNRPASNEAIDLLVSKVGKSLPDEVRNYYLTHNGMSQEQTASLVYGVRLSPVESAVGWLEQLTRLTIEETLEFADPGIRKDYLFGPCRIPIADDNGTSLICIDLDPDEGGQYGQIILLDYDYNVALKLATSIDEMFRSFAMDLRAGRYTLQEEALADGNEWLHPAREIDPINWFNSPTWRYVRG
ncbi:SMI1/KNR4 family protein [Pokkaliibacter sp. MBI-7]|uniref:SMI1/KNR4 family protein n=1 Tax=Pokkaliibacter sp. MBI-7 TaxID=3040600 RepID=UPI002449A020|nr:SMI1/KNR4 family protein [Pokkaliibacter sp. MBI-7]MDH2432552.1 SMI1/KNR4 family protein [Pokkaliibacter sp. MBI-7]